jgi:FixJ family two-component response regulator
MSDTSNAFNDGRIEVAIVDDDVSVRTAVTRVCGVSGLAPKAFGSGQEFLAALADDAHFDCLLLDAHMPVMTGAEVQRQLIARRISIPTIIFTADCSANVFLEFDAMGALACLRKPVSSEVLIATIYRVAQRVIPSGARSAEIH